MVLLLFLNNLPQAIAEDYVGSFDLSVQSGDVQGVTANSTHIWVVDQADAEVYKYKVDGTYVNSFDIAANGVLDAKGITANSTHIWICDNADDEVYKYKIDGTYVNSFDISGQMEDAQGIATDETYIYVAGLNPDRVYKYTMVGVYQSNFTLDTMNGEPYGITTDGTYIWVADDGDDAVYKYNMTGTFETAFLVSGQSNDPKGVAINTDSIFIADITDDEIYEFETDFIAYTNIKMIFFSDKYQFTWTEGNNTDYVIVRKTDGNYLDNSSNGTLVGNVTAGTEIITDYSQNEETYYSMWGWNDTFNYYHSQYDFAWGDFGYENVTEEVYYHENITFNGYINSTGTAFVNYTDTRSQTEDTNISVYQINASNGNRTLFHTNETTDNSDFTFNFTVNTSNAYEVLLRFNHTLFGYQKGYFLLSASGRNITNLTRFEDRFENLFGDTPFGWASLIGFVTLIICMFAFGSRNAGVGLIITGGVMLTLSYIIGATILDGTLAVLFIVLGVLVQWIGSGYR